MQLRMHAFQEASSITDPKLTHSNQREAPVATKAALGEQEWLNIESAGKSPSAWSLLSRLPAPHPCEFTSMIAAKSCSIGNAQIDTRCLSQLAIPGDSERVKPLLHRLPVEENAPAVSGQKRACSRPRSVWRAACMQRRRPASTPATCAPNVCPGPRRPLSRTARAPRPRQLHSDEQTRS